MQHAVLALGPTWLDPQHILDALGPWALWGAVAIVFAECGLLIGFLLPGDSLLFTVGLLISTGVIAQPIWLACLVLALAAFVGNVVGYEIGRRSGPAIFSKEDSRIFKKEYVDKTVDFFDRYGSRAIVLARFVPIVRTFITVTAGVGQMDRRRFLTYSGIGGTAWAGGVTLLGSLLGRVEFIKNNLEAMLLSIVLISVVPIGIEFLRERAKARRGADVVAPPPLPDPEDGAPHQGMPHQHGAPQRGLDPYGRAGSELRWSPSGEPQWVSPATSPAAGAGHPDLAHSDLAHSDLAHSDLGHPDPAASHGGHPDLAHRDPAHPTASYPAGARPAIPPRPAVPPLRESPWGAEQTWGARSQWGAEQPAPPPPAEAQPFQAQAPAPAPAPEQQWPVRSQPDAGQHWTTDQQWPAGRPAEGDPLRDSDQSPWPPPAGQPGWGPSAGGARPPGSGRHVS